MAIDRERCILCYRCVRFSQEVAEDYQLVFLDRGDHTFVGTHDGRPYVAPFSGNIIELCPVGALTSTAYRFRARPWDIEGSGTVCTMCPSQCNVELTVRDDAKVVRVLARDNEEVDDGWLCDKGRFGYQAFASPERITAPLVRDGGFLREVSWERALSEAAAALERSGERTAALVGGGATNEEGFLVQHLLREGLGSPHVDSRAAGRLSGEHARALARPELVGEGLRHRPRRRDPRARHRARRGGADPRPARAQGGAPQRRPAGGGVGAPVHARPATRPPRCASRPARPRRRSAPWPRRSAARASPGVARRAGRQGARRRQGFRPGRSHQRRRARERRPTPCAPSPTSCATPATSS